MMETMETDPRGRVLIGGKFKPYYGICLRGFNGNASFLLLY